MVTTYTYDAANRLTKVGNTNLEWDDAGNLLEDQNGTEYTYDVTGRMVKVEQGEVVCQYAYSGRGDRLSQSVAGQTTEYSLDIVGGLTQVLVAHPDTGGNDGSNVYLYGLGRLGEEQAAGWVYHLPDALGSVRQLADSSGDITLARSFRPYGELLDSDGTGSTTYGFTNEYTDSYIKLIYLRSRYYSPETGRFLSADTWPGDYTRPLSLNRWNYVEGNPINLVDPTGNVPCCDPIRIPHTFRFSMLPVRRPDLTFVQWFGDTVFAQANRGDYEYSRGLHAGFDLGAPAGSFVYAGIHGVVKSVFRNADVFAPNYLIIQPKANNHPCILVNRVVLYGHLGDIFVDEDDSVTPLTRIGITEDVEDHLHMEIRDYKPHYNRWVSDNLWFYNPAYYMHQSGMKILEEKALSQFRSTYLYLQILVEFVGEVDVDGNPRLGDPFSQPIRIPR